MFYFADNQSLTAANSKMAKLLSLCNAINEALVQFGKYFGRRGRKMFVHGKPIRFGFKIWMLVEQTVIRTTCSSRDAGSDLQGWGAGAGIF